MEAIRFDFNHIMSDFLGEGKGHFRDMLTSMEGPPPKRCKGVQRPSRRRQGDGRLGRPAGNQDETVDATIIKKPLRFAPIFENFVVLGIGGGALVP